MLLCFWGEIGFTWWVGFVWWLWVNKVIIYSFRKCLALWWNELHLECESLYVLPCPVRSKWHDHLLALSVREIRWNNVVFIRSHIFYEHSLGSIVNYESIFSQLHWKISCFVFCWFELVTRGRVFIGYGQCHILMNVHQVLFWTIYILKISPDLANCSLWVIDSYIPNLLPL
jgi:hypothetical protein